MDVVEVSRQCSCEKYGKLIYVSSIVAGEIIAESVGGRRQYWREITVTEIGGASVTLTCRSHFKKDLALRRKLPKARESSNEWLVPKLYKSAEK